MSGPPHPLPADSAADVLRRMPAAVALVEDALEAGAELGGAWLVGGCVRDAVLGRPPLDVDLAVEGDGVAFARQLAELLGGRVLATHDFGTASIVVPSRRDEIRVDVASARTERYEQPGALPTVQLAASIEDDLRRRDFTINAVAIPLLAGEAAPVFAPGVGQSPGAGWADDILAGVVRVLHTRSFIDDPTRMLRAVRYAGRLGFGLDAQTAGLLEQAVRTGALTSVSRQRLATELELICREPAAMALDLLVRHGIAGALAPALEDRLDERLNLMARIDDEWSGQQGASAAAWHARMAVLASPLGSDGAALWMRESAFPARDAAAVAAHLRLLELVLEHDERIATSSPTELLDLVGTDDPHVIAFAALASGESAGASLERYAAAVRNTSLSITGHDLLALGFERGPELGRALDELYRRKLAGQLPTPDAERNAARALAEDRRA